MSEFNNNEVMRQINRVKYYNSVDVDIRTQEDLLSIIDVEHPACQLLLNLKIRWPIDELYKDGTIEDLMRVLPELNIRAPAIDCMLRCYELPLKKVRVVFIGQDPYPGIDPLTKISYACGRAFACPNDVRERPGSQQRLLEMVETDLGYKSTVTPDLEAWVKQGVLLCNASPTLHTYKDRKKMVSGISTTVWTRFTCYMLQQVAKRNPNAIFVPFGKSAHSFEETIKEVNISAIVIRAPHPSRRNKNIEPLPVFKAIEQIQELLEEDPIVW